MVLIEYIVHQLSRTTHELDVAVLPKQQIDQEKNQLQTMGFFTAVAIAIHNFPEGLATFVATLEDPSVGISLAVAIAIHNIPEGLCVAIPVYYATGNRWKGFRWGVYSGLTEPFGALMGYFILKDSFGPMAYGVVFGMVGGMMVFIVLHELLPTARPYDPHDKVVTLFFIVGLALMAFSLTLFVIDPDNGLDTNTTNKTNGSTNSSNTQD